MKKDPGTKKKDKRKQQLYITLLLFLIMTGVIVVFVLKNELAEGKLRSYTFTEFGGSERHDGLTVSVNRGEFWKNFSEYPTRPYGAEYDFIITSDSSAHFQNWMTEIDFTDEPAIDSSWNGEFTIGGNRMYFVPENTVEMDLTSILPGMSRTFGAIIYTSDREDPERIVLTGTWYRPALQQTAFWVLFAIWVVLLFILIQWFLIYKRTQKYRQQIEKDYEMVRQAMLTMTDFIDAKDSYTRGHSTRVAIYSQKLAERLGMNEDERRDLYYIALMHDCGKVGVPDAVLKKPGRLTDDEFRLIKAHASIGNHLLTHFTTIPNISDGAHYHHERYDGSGYPDGLSGQDIPYVARIICIADAVDAMSTNRCYRDRLPVEKIISELTENAGIQFDPVMVPAMIQLIRDGVIEEAQELYPNRSYDT